MSEDLESCPRVNGITHDSLLFWCASTVGATAKAEHRASSPTLPGLLSPLYCFTFNHPDLLLRLKGQTALGQCKYQAVSTLLLAQDLITVKAGAERANPPSLSVMFNRFDSCPSLLVLQICWLSPDLESCT